MGGVREVPVSGGRTALIDEADYESIQHWKWSSCRKRHTFAVYRAVLEQGKSRRIYLSRFIMQAPSGLFVDHENGDGLDNRRDNLRLCTHTENNRHRCRPQSTNTSGHRGVFWERGAKKWRAQLSVNNRNVHLGMFLTVEDAGNAYRQAAVSRYGEFVGRA